MRVGLGGPWGRGVTNLAPKGGRESDAPGPYTRASGGRSASSERRGLAWDVPPGDPATKHPRSIGTGRSTRRRGAPAAVNGRLGRTISIQFSRRAARAQAAGRPARPLRFNLAAKGRRGISRCFMDRSAARGWPGQDRGGRGSSEPGGRRRRDRGAAGLSFGARDRNRNFLPRRPFLLRCGNTISLTWQAETAAAGRRRPHF